MTLKRFIFCSILRKHEYVLQYERRDVEVYQCLRCGEVHYVVIDQS